MKLTSTVCKMGLDPLPLILWENGASTRLAAIAAYRSKEGRIYHRLAAILARMGDYPAKRRTDPLDVDEAASRLLGALQ